mgnify:CR=1 FL=1
MKIDRLIGILSVLLRCEQVRKAPLLFHHSGQYERIQPSSPAAFLQRTQSHRFSPFLQRQSARFLNQDSAEGLGTAVC